MAVALDAAPLLRAFDQLDSELTDHELAGLAARMRHRGTFQSEKQARRFAALLREAEMRGRRRPAEPDDFPW